MKHVVVGTAGHIDHGKSALVRALTGIDPDRLKEEKQRGITIDLGFAFLRGQIGDGDEISLGFVDVPGHERFVKNMLAGVGGMDLVMLVIAADESVMPQTREHFEICRLIEVKRGLIALTKVDLVDPDLRELAVLEAKELVAGSFLEGAPICFLSSRTGEGIDDLKTGLFDLAREVPPRSTTGLMRLPVDRVFSMKGFGTVVTGTLVAGVLELDDEVEILPIGLKTRVRGLQVHGGRVDRATAGQRTAVNLQGIEVHEVERGDTLARKGTLPSSLMLDAELEVLPSSPIPIKDLTRVHVHLGTSQAVTRVRVLGGQPQLQPGQRGLVQLRLESPVVALPGDRFILRRYSPVETLGGGVVLDASPSKHAVKSPAVTEKLSRLRSLDLHSAAALFLEEAGLFGLSAGDLSRRLGVDRERLRPLVARLLEEGKAHRVVEEPPHLVALSVAGELSSRLLGFLERYQKAHPLRDGMPKGELREKLGAPDALFDWTLARLTEEGSARAQRDLVATADHSIQLTPEESDTRDWLADSYRRAGYQPLGLKELASRHHKNEALLSRIERLLLQEGTLIKVAQGLIFHQEVLVELKSTVRLYKQTSDRIDVGVFKQMAGVTRKYAIPLLEWLDKEKVTRRSGSDRVIL